MNDQLDKFFFARLEDLRRCCERDGCGVFSVFLDERQCAEAEKWCRYNIGELSYSFHGGFEDANRKILAVYPVYCQEYIGEEIPIRCLTFTYRREDKLSHRDFLGSFMALRLKRETIGDIAVAEGKAQAAVTKTAARDITASLSKIGRTGVKITEDQPFDMRLADTQEFKEICGTVASLRLDCVAALAANVSREKAAAIIRSEKADVNHFTVTDLSHIMAEGDILSIRGCGRFVLSGINGVTKKHRIHIILKKFI